MNPLEKKVLDFAHKEQLWEKGQSLLLAISGGPDSVCLFFTMLALSQREDLSLGIAHIDHGTRGNSSYKDALFVEKLATTHNLPFYKHTLPKTTLNYSEVAYRKIRYAFFEKLARRYSFDRVVLGHHADDQVETFLLRLLRGSGPEGLKSMSSQNGLYIRPLLFLWKKDILTYLKKSSHSYRTDLTNKQNIYQRNKVRNILIPYLEKNYQPKLRPLFLQTIHLIQESIPLQMTTPSIGIIHEEHALSFSLEKFLTLEPREQSHFIRKVTLHFLSQPISQRLSLEIQKTLTSNKNKVQTMTFHGLKLSKKGATVTLQKILSD